MPDAPATDDDVLNAGDVLDGQYVIEAELGRGGIGVVYKAHDGEHDIPVAIKMLLPKWAKDRKMKARFLREPRLAIRARHPNIVQILAIKQPKNGGAPYIVMEFIEGKQLLDLFRHARQQGAPYGLAFLPLAGQLASVLAACHARNIVHRDLKPANIMVVRDDDVIGGLRVKLLDFGIAKVWDEDETAQTSVGDQQPGTPSYMAPEQLTSMNKELDPSKMDVYALGAILYQAVAGKLPLWAPDQIAMTYLLAHEEPAHLHTLDPTLPESLVQLIHEMLAKDPLRRPTMDQARERLKSRREIVSILPTRELMAIAPESLSEGGGTASTADATASAGPALAGSTAPPMAAPAKSLGEKSTRLQVIDDLAADGGVSSIGRLTGQQLTNGQTRQNRQRLLRRVALAGAGLLAVALAIGTWRGSVPAAGVTTTPQIAPPNPLPPQALVALVPPPPSTPPIASPLDTLPASPVPPTPKTQLARAKPVCETVTEACLRGKATMAQRQAVLAALADAKIKLCPTDSLRVGPEFDLTASGVRKNRQDEFLVNLRGLLHGAQMLTSALEIRCAAK